MTNGRSRIADQFKIYNENYFKGNRDLSLLRIRRTVSLLGKVIGTRILDLGCGTGEGSRLLRSMGANVVSFDIARYAVSVCHDSGLEAVRGAAQKLPFREACFHGVLFMDVIEHLPKSKVISVLKEIKRVTKPSGKIAIHTMPNLFLEKLSIIYGLMNRKHWRRPGIQGGHINTYTSWRFKSEVEASGLEIISFDIGSYPSEAPFSPIVTPISSHFKWLLGNDFWIICIKKDQGG